MGVIGDKIKHARSESNMSIKELSVKSGIGQSTISEIETGKAKNPKTDTIKKLSEALNINVADLFNDAILEAREMIRINEAKIHENEMKIIENENKISKRLLPIFNELYLKGNISKDSYEEIKNKSPEEQYLLAKELKDKLAIILFPKEFTIADEARAYISMHQMFNNSNFINEMSDEEVLNFANEMLRQIEMVSYKYKK